MPKDESPKAEPLARPDPGKALAGLTGALERLGGVDGALGKLDSSEARSDLISIKLTILLEYVQLLLSVETGDLKKDVDWQDDPRIAAWEARHKTKLKRSKK